MVKNVGKVMNRQISSKIATGKYAHLSNLTAFVVSTQNSDSVAVAHLEADEQRDGFNGVVATVDVISHEEVVGIRRLASNSEQLDQVVPLTMNITANGHRAVHALDIRLSLKDLSRLHQLNTFKIHEYAIHVRKRSKK